MLINKYFRGSSWTKIMMALKKKETVCNGQLMIVYRLFSGICVILYPTREFINLNIS